jgi:predicted transcriptional regulator
MNVALFLTPKADVAWVPVDATIEETLSLMCRTGHATVPVLADGRYLGTVSEATLLNELLRAELRHAASPRDETIASLVIDRTSPTLGVDTSIESLLLRVVAHSFLAVVDDRGVFIGIVRRRDVLAHFAELLVPLRLPAQAVRLLGRVPG